MQVGMHANYMLHTNYTLHTRYQDSYVHINLSYRSTRIDVYTFMHTASLGHSFHMSMQPPERAPTRLSHYRSVFDRY